MLYLKLSEGIIMFKFFKKKKIKDELTLALETEFNEIDEIFKDQGYFNRFNESAIKTYLVYNYSDKYAIGAMVKKYKEQFASATKEEKEKIIQNMKALKNYVKQYIYEIFSDYYHSGNNQKYEETKSILLEKANKLLEKEISEEQAEKLSNIKAQKEKQNKIEEDIRNL